jgi:outer membrane protein assembly factor BamB
MKAVRQIAITVLLCAWVGGTDAGAEDWRQWQGPDRSNRSTETGLLKSWPSEGPRRLWLYDNAGSGYSGPAIAEGVLYTMGTRDDQEILLALDALTGEERWTLPVDEVLSNGWGDGPRGTPTVSGNRVYALSGRGTVIGAQLPGGELLWKKDLTSLGGRRPNWGYTESVLVDGDHVVCTPGGRQGTVAALHKDSGELVWQSSQLTDAAQYASLVIAEIQGVRQYVQLTMDHVVGIRASNGDLLWQSDFPGQTAVIPTPVVHGNSVYVTAGYGVGSKLVTVGPDQQAEEVYFNKVMKNHHGGVVLVGEHLFGYSDGGGWVCQDLASGEMIWNERNKLGKGSLTFADGLLFCVTESGGEVALVDASSQGWSEKSRFKLEPQSSIRSARGRIWTHPVVANGKLYLRDQEFIYCYDVAANP